MSGVQVAKAIIRRASDGKYLLLTSSIWEGRPDRSQQPDLPGGTVEPGESSIEGCIREVDEETGITISQAYMRLVYDESFASDYDDAVVQRSIYLVDVAGEQSVKLSWEHESYEWITLDELLRMTMRQPYPDIFRYCFEQNLLT